MREGVDGAGVSAGGLVEEAVASVVVEEAFGGASGAEEAVSVVFFSPAGVGAFPGPGERQKRIARNPKHRTTRRVAAVGLSIVKNAN